MNKDNRKFYFDAVDDSEIDSILHQCVAQGDNKVILWAENETKEDAENYQIESYDKKNKCIHFRPEGLLNNIIVSKKIGTKVLYRLNSTRFYFFSTAVLNFDKNSGLYSFIISDTLYRGQQRGQFRFIANERVSISAKFGIKEFKCKDISSSGLCLSVPTSEVSYFEIGKDFLNVKIQFDTKKYRIYKAVVKAISEDSENSNNSLVGVFFSDIHNKTDEDLFKQINLLAKEEDDLKKRGY